MQAHKIPVFKPWVSEWIARTVIFALLMTCLFSFAFYGSPVAAMGFYGIQPTDVQYGTVVIYGSTVAFLALDFRVVKYVAPRKYLLIGLAINGICSVICFHFKDWTLFVVCQFAQGITCALISSIVLQLIFPRLHSVRARVIAFSLLYGCIQIAVPFYSIYASVVVYFFDFNWLFVGFNIVLIILTAMVLLTMNGKARFTKKIPLYQVDWIGYVFYVFFILALGYILVHGRRLGWFDSPFIRNLSVLSLVVLVLFIIRALTLKRPLINVQVFKENHVVRGLLLLFTFYIFKGSTGLAYGYLEVILGNDPLNTVPIWTAVILGTTLSMFVTARYVLMGFDLMRMIIVGFGIMAIYYVYMILFVSVQGETLDFVLPMFIFGVATGVLFVPIVTFTASTVPPKLAVNASLVGIFARFCGFTASLAFSNELQLFAKSAVREKVREAITETNPQLSIRLAGIQDQYVDAGRDIFTAKAISANHLDLFVRAQILSRATRDYYELMLIGVLCIIIILVFLPKINDALFLLKKKQV